MMTLDEIKKAMHEAVDKAWEALHGTHDMDEARKVAQETTAQLQDHVLAVEANLVNHVAENAAEAAQAENAATETTSEASAKTETPEDPASAAADKTTTTASAKKASK